MAAMLKDVVRERKDVVDKKVSFTKEGLEVLSSWANEKGVSFSAAVEGLALLGLDDERFETFVPIAEALISKAIIRVFNRYFRLHFMVAEEASKTYQMCSTLMLLRLAAGCARCTKR